jgi:hypothetical protein
MRPTYFASALSKTMRALATLSGLLSLYWAGADSSENTVPFFGFGCLTLFLFAAARALNRYALKPRHWAMQEHRLFK